MQAINLLKAPFYNPKTFAVIVVLILLIGLIYNLFFPLPALDGPWYLSHAFSVINGHQFKNTFAADYIDFYNLPYLYGDLSAIFYFPFAHTTLNLYSIFIINFILILALLFLYYKLYLSLNKRFDFVFIFFVLAVIFSSATYLQRPETIEQIIIILFHLYLIKYNAKPTFIYYIIIGVFITVTLLIHPVGGIYTIAFFSLYSLENIRSFKQYLLSGLTTLIIFSLSYLPVVMIDFAQWKLNFFTRSYDNEQRGASFYHVIKFCTYAYPLVGFTLLFFSSLRKPTLLKELIIILLFVIILMPFGRYYYYAYFFHLIFWRASAQIQGNVQSWKKILASCFILPGLAYSILPYYQILENKSYASTFTKSLEYARTASLQNPDKKVWVSPYLAMAVIDQNNGRLFYEHYVDSRGEKPLITNDIFLIEHLNMKDYIKGYLNNSTDSLQIKNILQPVKGLIKIGINDQRSDSLGLWEITVIKK